MDPDRVAFLFGQPPAAVLLGQLLAAADLTDEHVRRELLRADRPGSGERMLAVRTAVAAQVLADDPPEVWWTARRLSAVGRYRHDVMDELTRALLPLSDRGGYVARLHALPRSEEEVAGDVCSETVLRHGVVTEAEVADRVAARLGREPGGTDDVLARHDVEVGEFAEERRVAPGLVVHAPTLVHAAVLTRRPTAQEHAAGRLRADTDLAAFGCLHGPRWPEPRFPADSFVGVTADTDGRVWWRAPGDHDAPASELGRAVWEELLPAGPAGWTAWGLDVPADAVLAVRVPTDGVLSVTVLPDDPPAPQGLVDLLRAAYDAESARTGLPVDAAALLLGVLARDRDAFAAPRPPLEELAGAAGLERRGAAFAHDAATWDRQATAELRARLGRRLHGVDLDAAVAAAALLGDRATSTDLRTALDLLDRPDVRSEVVDELLGEDDPARVAAVVAVTERLMAVADGLRRVTTAGWFAAVAAERDGRVLDAEAHLRTAAGLGAQEVDDRLAWYEADRGDATGAVRRWAGVDASRYDAAAHAARPFCGGAVHPLADRVGWLWEKARAYVRRRGGRAGEARWVDGVLADRAGDSIGEPALYDLAVDVALHEGGWFARFLADRGPLLPPDERALARTWLDVPREVYRVVDHLPRVEPYWSDGAPFPVVGLGPVEPGEVVGARIVPVGAARHAVGVVLPSGGGWNHLSRDEGRDCGAVLQGLVDFTLPPGSCDPGGSELTAALTPTLSGPVDAVLDAHFRRSGGEWQDHGTTLRRDGPTLHVRGLEYAMQWTLDALARILPFTVEHRPRDADLPWEDD